LVDQFGKLTKPPLSVPAPKNLKADQGEPCSDDQPDEIGARLAERKDRGARQKEKRDKRAYPDPPLSSSKSLELAAGVRGHVRLVPRVADSKRPSNIREWGPASVPPTRHPDDRLATGGITVLTRCVAAAVPRYIPGNPALTRPRDHRELVRSSSS
jgi:hypothetical protein